MAPSRSHSLPSSDAASSLSADIVKQLEVESPWWIETRSELLQFYFGDANLPRDKFLNAEVKKNEEGL